MTSDRPSLDAIELTVRSIAEKDIDLLILEELVVSPAFLRYFLGRIGLSEDHEITGAVHSVTTSNGESDLELDFSDGIQKTRVLIENKVDAPLQPRQDQRYAERARAYISAAKCDRAITVLVSPGAYAEHEGFDSRIKYEEILDWFRKHSDGHARRHYKILLLDAALRRATEGWTLVPDAPATELWLRYWELTSRIAPQLAMPRPGSKPATSSFVYFQPAGLGNRVNLIHKLLTGTVDLQFNGGADGAENFYLRYSSTLRPGMSIKKAGKALAVRIAAPPVFLQTPFEECETELRLAISSASELLDWYLEVIVKGDQI